MKTRAELILELIDEKGKYDKLLRAFNCIGDPDGTQCPECPAEKGCTGQDDCRDKLLKWVENGNS